MNKLRKFLVIGVMVMTVFATMGMVAPRVEAAASAGDLIKMDGLSSVYYLGADGKRYVFPNTDTYMSWYSDFSGVVTIPAAELQSYPLGGNVVMRPGTKLVKITTDPTVYAVEPNGTLRSIVSEANAIALYGTNWNKRIVDVPDAFFTNYTISSPLTVGQVPAGSLVKSAASADVYYYDGTNYRSIASEAAFHANRFQFSNVLTVSNAITAGGTAIATAELVNVAQGGTPTGPVVTGSGLMVSLNASTPVSASVPQNGARIPMAKVNLTAANDGAVTVNSITVKRIGLSSYSNIDKVWAEQNGNIVASKKSMNSNDESILVFSPALVVNAGQTATLDLIASLTGTGAGNIGLSIASASAVSATAASVTGSFPINGNIMSPTTYSVVNLMIDGSVATTQQVKVGDEKIELGRFTLGFDGTGKDSSIKSITLKNNGVEDLSKTTMNLYLEQAGEKVSTGYSIDGRYVTFQFANGLDLLKDDSSKIFYLKGDVIAKENTATTSFVFVLNKSTDLVAEEKATGFAANVNKTGSVVADNYTVANVEISSGAISVSKKASSPAATSIIKGSDNLMLVANIRVDEAISADGLNLTYATTSADQFENVRVSINGLLLDSFDPATTSDSKAIESTFTLNKGDNELTIWAKAKSTATSSSKISFTLSGLNMFATPTNMNPEYVISGNSVTVIPGGSASGAEFTVEGALLETVKNDGYATDKAIVKGSTDVSLGKFVVKASNDAAKVTSVSLSANNGTTTKTLDTSISDMKLYVDGVQVGSTVDFGSTGATFSGLNFTIAKDSTKNIELFGSFDSAAVDDSYFKTTMTIYSQDSRGTSITSGNVATTTQFQIKGEGSLAVALGGDAPVAGMLASHANEQEVAQFRFTATNDDAKLNEINIINTPLASSSSEIASTSDGVADADARIASIRLYDGATLVDSFVPVSGEGKFVTKGKITVPANANKTLSIKVVLNDINNDASSTDRDIHLAITTVKFESSNGTEITKDVSTLANNFRIRKTVPTIALLPLPTTLLTAGDQVVSKFKVTADANGDVEVNKIVLNVATSASSTITKLGTASSLKVNGSYRTVATTTLDTASSTLIIELGSNGEIVSAGTEKTFEILATLGVSGSGSESVTTKISEDTSYGTDGSFVWSDGASLTVDTYSNGHRVSGLTTTTQVLSK